MPVRLARPALPVRPALEARAGKSETEACDRSAWWSADEDESESESASAPMAATTSARRSSSSFARG